MQLADIHARLANTALYYVIILALWGIWRAVRKQPVDSGYWGALAIGEALLLLQGGLGAFLWIGGERPGRSVHILYGVVAALIIPGIYAYTKGDSDRRVMTIYGIALLIAAGIIVRAMMTAAGA
ncbi:MAG: hypothetical protein L0Z70_00585 [Chloroflexi bacterium]|nr:hypothetical protein [Chloroflexota bacterium]